MGTPSKWYLCRRPDCGGSMAPLAKDGRFYRYRNVSIVIPASILIDRCLKCNRDATDEATTKRLSTILEALFQEHAMLIKGIFKEYEERTAK